MTEAIVELGAPKPNAQGLAFARRLFARAIETPGGLKIQTIHAFCERLLHLFPFEANVPAGFSVADDREAAALIAEARARAFAEDLSAPERAAEVERIARDAGAEGFDELLAETLSRRAEFDAIGDAKAYAAALRRALDLGAERNQRGDQGADAGARAAMGRMDRSSRRRRQDRARPRRPACAARSPPATKTCVSPPISTRSSPRTASRAAARSSASSPTRSPSACPTCRCASPPSRSG